MSHRPLAEVLRPLVTWLVIGGVMTLCYGDSMFGVAAGAVIGSEAGLGLMQILRHRMGRRGAKS